MKGNSEVIIVLNERLADHHTSYVECVTRAALCDKWGYTDLEEFFEKLAKEDLESIEKLMERIVFLDGIPLLVNINEVVIGDDIYEMITFVQRSKMSRVAGYSDGIDKAVSFKDYGTRHMFEKMIVNEDEYLADIEAKITQLERG